MKKEKTLLQVYENFARSIYQVTGLNDSIEIILPKDHFIRLVMEMTDDPFEVSIAEKCPVEVKILTSSLTFKIKYNYFSELT